MSLMNVTNTNGELTATANNSFAIAEPINQVTGENDFESLRDIRTRMLLSNICDVSLSTADRAVLKTPISTGDRIFIVDGNNIIHDTLASNILPANQGLIPVMTSNTAPVGVVSATNTLSNQNDAYKLFDNIGTYSFSLKKSDIPSGYITYNFANNTPVKATKFLVNIKNEYYQSYNTHEFILKGSNDGVNYVTLSVAKSNSSFAQGDNLFNIQNPGSFSYYSVTGVSNDGYQVTLRKIQLYAEGGQSIDTSAITKGSIPKHVYKYSPPVSFNGVKALEKDIYKEFGTNGESLYIASIFNDVLVNGRTIITRIDFDSTGDEMLELTAQVFKEA